MSPAIETQLATHHAEIGALKRDYTALRDEIESGIQRVEKKLDYLILGALTMAVSGLGGAIVMIVKLLHG